MKIGGAVYLVRHGETEWNRIGRLQGIEDIPLNEEGVSQARKVAESFRGIDIGVIVSSPLSRAYQTACIIRDCVGNVPITQYKDLMERDYGQASGMTREELDAHFPRGTIPPGLEDEQALKARAGAAFAQAVDEFGGEKIVIVSHGNLLKSLIAHLSDGKHGVGNFRMINCGVSKLVRRETVWEFEFVNQPIAG